MAGLYSQLGDGRKETQLLTLLPLSRGAGIIQCNLQTYVLDDFTPEFERFVSASADASLNRPQRISQWTDHQSASTSGSTTAKHGHAGEPPPSHHHRFKWGDYAALSYVWGDENNTTPIIVNEQELIVTRNLEKVLGAFNRHGEFQGDFKLWVDAVCLYVFRRQDSCHRFWRHLPPETAVLSQLVSIGSSRCQEACNCNRTGRRKQRLQSLSI
jgi:Heterokaryon incompatibility protein (HET)